MQNLPIKPGDEEFDPKEEDSNILSSFDEFLIESMLMQDGNLPRWAMYE